MAAGWSAAKRWSLKWTSQAAAVLPEKRWQRCSSLELQTIAYREWKKRTSPPARQKMSERDFMVRFSYIDIDRTDRVVTISSTARQDVHFTQVLC